MPDEDLTLLEAAIRFNVDPDELHLILTQYEASIDTSLTRYTAQRGSSIVTTYRLNEVEAAVAFSAAQRLGFDPNSA